MKNLYLNSLALLVSAFSLNAQVTLTKASYEPVIGDLDNRIHYDSTTVLPKLTGTNQLWNFTGMNAQSTYTISFINPASAPGNVLFPTATIVQNGVGESTYEFYRSTTSNYEFVGQVDPVNTETLVFSNSGILRSYPISYGSSSIDSWSALQTSGSGTMNMSGTATIAATGTGTVILPNGNVHPNCLQVTETITLTVVSGTTTMNGYFYNVFYYEAARKFPIFEYAYEAMGSIKFSASANSDALMAGINENRILNGAVSIYPNPVKDELYISLNGTEIPMDLQVMDMQGRDVLSKEYSNSINVESLEQGLYIIKLNYKDKMLYQRFVKNN
jgi:hypothetical protein